MARRCCCAYRPPPQQVTLGPSCQAPAPATYVFHADAPLDLDGDDNIAQIPPAVLEAWAPALCSGGSGVRWMFDQRVAPTLALAVLRVPGSLACFLEKPYVLS